MLFNLTKEFCSASMTVTVIVEIEAKALANCDSLLPASMTTKSIALKASRALIREFAVCIQ